MANETESKDNPDLITKVAVLETVVKELIKKNEELAADLTHHVDMYNKHIVACHK